MSQTAGRAEAGSADILRILQALPHRYPMLMVDRVVDIVPDESATGIKNVTINEPHFQGHFPRRPIMPGVMIVEAMAQTAAILVAYSEAGLDPDGKLLYFTTIDNARFRLPVTPGDTVLVHVVKRHRRGNMWKFDGRCEVDGKAVAEAAFGAMVTDE